MVCVYYTANPPQFHEMAAIEDKSRKGRLQKRVHKYVDRS